MDEADRAQAQIDADLARAIDLARPATAWAIHCRECDEPLPEHRQSWGLCIDCAQRREARELAYKRARA